MDKANGSSSSEKYSDLKGLMEEYRIYIEEGDDSTLSTSSFSSRTPFHPSSTSTSMHINSDMVVSAVHTRTIDSFYDQAHLLSTPSTKDGGLLAYFSTVMRRSAYMMIFLSLGLANVGDAVEIGSMGFLLAHDGFRLEIMSNRDGVVASALYIGMFMGGLVTGPLCDLYGRRNLLLGGLALNSIFGVAAAVVSTVWELLTCRLLMGCGIGCIVSCLLSLTSEHAPPRARGYYLNLVSAFWTIGSIWVAALALILFGKLDRSWRLYILINALPSSVSFFLVWIFVPESARFLALNQRWSEATHAANRVASSMGYTGECITSDELMNQFPPSAECVSENEKGSSLNTALAEMFVAFQSLYGSNEGRKRIILVQSLWFFISLGSGVCLWMARVFSELPFVEHVYAMTMFFAMASLPGVIVAGFIMDRMGRTRFLQLSLGMTAGTLLAFGLLSVLTHTGWAVVLSACVFHSCLVITWSVLSVVTAESFPTRTRSTAMGVSAASGRLASILWGIISAEFMNKNKSSFQVFLGASSFILGFVLVAMFPLQSMTGEPLQDGQGAQLARHRQSTAWKR